MAQLITNDNELTSLADHIRAKGGTTEPLAWPAGYEAAVDAIETGDPHPEDGFITGTWAKTKYGEYVNDRITSVATSVFKGSDFSSISLPNVTGIDADSAFYAARAIEIDLPKVENTWERSGLFASNKRLSNINIPMVITLGANSFSGDTNLTSITLLALDHIGDYVFGGSFIDTLILSRQRVVRLDNTNAFVASPIGSGSGYIYVPRNLLSRYKTATNWVAFADQIRAIEDYPDITGGAV